MEPYQIKKCLKTITHKIHTGFIILDKQALRMKTRPRHDIKARLIASMAALIVTLLLLFFALPPVMNSLAMRIPDNYEFIADEHIRSGRSEKALRILEKAAAERTWDPLPLNRLGLLLIRNGQNDEGVNHLLSACLIAFRNTTWPDMLNQRHRHRMAAVHFDYAVHGRFLEKRDPRFFHMTYAILLEPSFASMAETHIRDVISENPSSPDRTILLRQHYATLGTEPSPDPGLPDIAEIVPQAPPADSRPVFPGNARIVESRDVEVLADAMHFYKDSRVVLELTPPVPADTTIWINVRGTQAFGIYPVCAVTPDGGPHRFVYVNSPGFAWYAVPLSSGNAVSRISLAFLNDGARPVMKKDGTAERLAEDRNLFLKEIRLQINP